jgi:7-cyano-7-deazaguanine synthase
MKTRKKIVVLLSGGLDSTTLLWYGLNRGWEVRAVAVNYGQRHSVELLMATYQAKTAGVPLWVVDLAGLSKGLPGSSQTDLSVPVPEGHYTEETMKKTVVPNRNMILLSIAVGHAIGHGFDGVAYAAHAGDHAIYPDCRPEFTRRLGRAIAIADWRKIRLFRPFVCKTKADIVRIGHALGVDYAYTWSCYQGGKVHCGNCGTCVERREAFLLAGVPDPTPYAETAKPLEQLLKRS